MALKRVSERARWLTSLAECLGADDACVGCGTKSYQRISHSLGLNRRPGDVIDGDLKHFRKGLRAASIPITSLACW